MESTQTPTPLPTQKAMTPDRPTSGVFRKAMSHFALKKPKEVFVAEDGTSKLHRYLSLSDLVLLGIGGTVGSGVFATAGMIVNETAGPAAILSWAIAGVVCCITGLSFAEMSSRIPSTGSTYSYSYNAMGELFAVIAGWLLFLEYGVSVAGVARTWASKVVIWIDDLGGPTYWWMDSVHFSGLAAMLQFVAMIIIAMGLNLSKITINVVTVAKVLLLLMMIVAGLTTFNGENLEPFVPPQQDGQYGLSGVMLGATQAFFGYIGYDEVCCLAGEAKRPVRDIPRAVIFVIFGTALLSIMATFSLVGMQYYTEVDPESAFGEAFRSVGYNLIANITQAGEIVTMPVVVLIGFMAQPRIQYIMAVDGQLPRIFARVNEAGVILWGTLISGMVLTVVALIVPFRIIWDVVNMGILMSFNMTNSCVVLTRYRTHSPRLSPLLWWAYGLCSLTAAFTWVKVEGVPGIVLASIFTLAAFGVVCYLAIFCTQVKRAKGEDDITLAPFTPFLQALGMFANFYLCAQLEWPSIGYFVAYMVIPVLCYLTFGIWNSKGYYTNWANVFDMGDSANSITSRVSFFSKPSLGPTDTPQEMPEGTTPDYNDIATPALPRKQ